MQHKIEHQCKSYKTTCEKYFTKNTTTYSPITRLKADQIYEMMMQIKNGLCMTANPTRFTNKIVPNYDPLVKLRQNDGNEVEAACPLPIAKINVLNPSMVDEIRAVVLANVESLPQCNIALNGTDLDNFCKRIIKPSPPRLEADSPNYIYKIIMADTEPEKHLAVYPMQVKKWFPGMYTVYADHTDA